MVVFDRWLLTSDVEDFQEFLVIETAEMILAGCCRSGA